MGGSESRELSTSDLNDLKKNTKFRGDEIRLWYEKFHQDFPNGVINEPQFVSMYCKMFPKGDARRFAKHIFRAYDADGMTFRVHEYREYIIVFNLTVCLNIVLNRERRDRFSRVYDNYERGCSRIKRRKASLGI